MCAEEEEYSSCTTWPLFAWLPCEGGWLGHAKDLESEGWEYLGRYKRYMDYYELLWTYIDLYHFHFSRILPSPQRTHHDNPLLARCFFGIQRKRFFSTIANPPSRLLTSSWRKWMARLIGTHDESSQSMNQPKLGTIFHLKVLKDVAVCQNLVPLVNIKIAGKWMYWSIPMWLFMWHFMGWEAT